MRKGLIRHPVLDHPLDKAAGGFIDEKTDFGNFEQWCLADLA